MHLAYGSYVFDENSCDIRMQRRPVVNGGGQTIEMMAAMDVEGWLGSDGDGEAEIAQKASALITAMSIPYQDLVLYTTAGAATDTALLNAGSISGVLIKGGVDFPNGRGAEYVNFRRFRFRAEASYPFNGTGNALRFFSERISFSGGGPIYRHRMALNGRPQKQLVYKHSIYRAVQEGEAIGYLARPTPPSPLWPDAQMEAVDMTLDSPERRGNGYSDFRVTWRYNFESASPLVGQPNIWRS